MSNVTAVPIPPVKRGYLVWLWLGVIVAILAAAALAAQGTSTLPPKIGYQVLKAGDNGAHPGDTDVVLVQYEGRLADGTVFDKSTQPTPFPVNAVVPGFGQGLKMMTKGTKARMTIPPQLGYGDKAAGPIPANSTLTFDVELLDFKTQAEIEQLRAQMQQMMGAQGGAAAPGGR